MRGCERCRRLLGDIDRLVQAYRLATHPLAERLALYELGRDISRASIFADLVNSKNVGMIERRCGFGFLDEPTHPVAILGDVIEQDLKSHLPFKSRVLGQIDLTHPAFSYGGDHLVMGYIFAGTRHRGLFGEL